MKKDIVEDDEKSVGNGDSTSRSKSIKLLKDEEDRNSSEIIDKKVLKTGIKRQTLEEKKDTMHEHNNNNNKIRRKASNDTLLKSKTIKEVKNLKLSHLKDLKTTNQLMKGKTPTFTQEINEFPDNNEIWKSKLSLNGNQNEKSPKIESSLSENSQFEESSSENKIISENEQWEEPEHRIRNTNIQNYSQKEVGVDDSQLDLKVSKRDGGEQLKKIHNNYQQNSPKIGTSWQNAIPE